MWNPLSDTIIFNMSAIMAIATFLLLALTYLRENGWIGAAILLLVILGVSYAVFISLYGWGCVLSLLAGTQFGLAAGAILGITVGVLWGEIRKHLPNRPAP